MLSRQFSKFAKFLSFLVLLILCLTAATNTTFAQAPTDGSQNFSIKLHSTYTVTATGRTLVEQKFTITNKTPELFVSKYGIVVSSTNLSNVEITHNGKALEPSISKNKGQTSIGVTFADPVVGEGKSNELIIHYSDQDLALISGKILEINIPKLSDHYQYQNYQLELRVPSIFDTPSRINPSNFALRQDGDYNVITYNDLGEQSVSAIFGHKQLFDLKLNYYLHNPTSQTALTQITLPPETPHQKVHYLHLEPMPKDIKEDQDGNFIATYEIPANNSFYVELLAQVTLTLNPDPLIAFSPVLPDHLQEQKFWEISHQSIAAASEPLESVKSIYDFTVDTLHYTSRPIDQNFDRLGAAAALRETNLFEATCQEFTDLFIALARQKNLAARRLVGIAYSNNEELRPSNLTGDILHTWPEFYDSEEQAWQRVDPTWEKTTGGVDYFNNFDLNHIVLAINGVSSTLPYPAGSYLGEADEQNKKIYLDFSKEEYSLPTPSFAADLIPKTLYGVPIPGNYELQIINQTGKVWYFTDLRLSSASLDIVVDQKQASRKILPFAKISLPFSVYNRGATDEAPTIKVDLLLQEGQSSSYEFEVTTSLQLALPATDQILLVGGGLIVLTLLAGSLFLLGRFLTHSLRRQGQKLEEESHKLQAISTSLKENSKNDRTSGQNRTPSPRQ